MVEFKIELEESIVQAFGYKEVEQYLQDFVKKMLLNAAGQDILEDLKTTDFQNDKEWQKVLKKYYLFKPLFLQTFIQGFISC